MVAAELLPQDHYPTKQSLAEIITEQMGSSEDPDEYLLKEKVPTDKERKNRNANVAARVDGSIN